jgi:CheY-like chemotaxis protein
MQAILAQFGCSITQAFCGEEAVDLAATVAFDLIVMDFHMPGISGDEAAAQIRARGPSRLAYMVQWSTDPPGRLSAALYDAALPKPITCAGAAEALAAAQRRSEDRALDHAAPPPRRSRQAGL